MLAWYFHHIRITKHRLPLRHLHSLSAAVGMSYLKLFQSLTISRRMLLPTLATRPPAALHLAFSPAVITAVTVATSFARRTLPTRCRWTRMPASIQKGLPRALATSATRHTTAGKRPARLASSKSWTSANPSRTRATLSTKNRPRPTLKLLSGNPNSPLPAAFRAVGIGAPFNQFDWLSHNVNSYRVISFLFLFLFSCSGGSVDFS